jgi:hypothetical protein
MSAGRREYTTAEILAFGRMSYHELERLGLHQSSGRPAGQRSGPYVAKRKPTRDYLSEPIDYPEAWRL